MKDKSDELTRNVDTLRRQDYIHRVNLAYREILNDNTAFAIELLEGCPPDLRGWEWSYVWRQCHLEIKTLGGHRNEVCSVAFSPDGERIASGSGMQWAGSSQPIGELIVNEVRSGRELFARREIKGSVMAVVYSPDGRWMASGNSYTGTDYGSELMVWDASTGERRMLVTIHRSLINKLRFSPDGQQILAAMNDSLDWNAAGSIRSWDITSGKEGQAFGNGTGSLLGIAIRRDGKQASLARFDSLEVWDLDPTSLDPDHERTSARDLRHRVQPGWAEAGVRRMGPDNQAVGHQDRSRDPYSGRPWRYGPGHRVHS